MRFCSRKFSSESECILCVSDETRGVHGCRKKGSCLDDDYVNLNGYLWTVWSQRKRQLWVFIETVR